MSCIISYIQAWKKQKKNILFACKWIGCVFCGGNR